MTNQKVPRRPKAIKICKTADCGRSAVTGHRGCGKCNYRQRVYGNPNAAITRLMGDGETVEERFWSRIEKTENCWIWKGSQGLYGYGLSQYRYKTWRAHRLAWFLTFGRVPDGILMHSCDNRICVNPNHLHEGTPKQNSQDMVSKGRQATGEKQGRALLTNQQAEEIRQLLSGHEHRDHRFAERCRGGQMILILANIVGWAIAHKRLLLYIAAGLGLLLLLVFVFRSCGSKAKVDLETVDKINSKNAAEAKKAVRETVEDNLAVATTVDNRTTLADANIVERERLIEEKIKEVNQKVAEAKAEKGNVTQEDLECILVPANCS